MGLVKLCGMVRQSDIQAGESAGADYLGLVIEFPRSPRSLSLEAARQLIVESSASFVAVVVDPDDDLLLAIMNTIRPASIQLSGGERPTRVRELNTRFPSVQFWKVLHVGVLGTAEDVRMSMDRILQYRDAGVDTVMIDADVKGTPGGTGQRLNWESARQIVATAPVSVILAGGLSPSNIREAISICMPAGVDVSSGTESAPGVKDHKLMAAFTREARQSFADIKRT